MKFLYLLINFCSVIVPLLFSFHPKLKFYKRLKSFFPACLLTATFFIVWDIFFTAKGVWGFNNNYITGIYFFNLPLEEILFFICIPFACVFTYHCLNIFFKMQWQPRAEDVFILTVATLLLTSGLIFQSKVYTAVTLISLSFLLLLLKFILHANWIGKLVTIYPLLLIPFFIVNGILTGSGLENPVVWYNADEIIGLRILTIPVEDFFYGFELIIINVFIYEYFENKSAGNRHHVTQSLTTKQI